MTVEGIDPFPFMKVAAAAKAWVESIHDHPNSWAGREDYAIIEAVRECFPDVICQWVTNPDYAGWTEAWKELT